MNKLTILRLSKVSILRQCPCFFLETIMQRSREKTISKSGWIWSTVRRTHPWAEKESSALDFDPVILVTLGQNEIDHHFHYAKKKSCQELVPPFPILKRWVCGTMHQIRIVNVLGESKGLLFTDLPLKKNQSQVVKSFWEDSILDYPSFNLILFGWISSQKTPIGSIHFLKPTRKFHFPFSSLWDKVLGCNVEGFHVLDIEQKSEACKTKKKHITWRWLM